MTNEEINWKKLATQSVWLFFDNISTICNNSAIMQDIYERRREIPDKIKSNPVFADPKTI